MNAATCSVDDCCNKAHCRTWCHLHYSRWKRHGDPLIAGKPRRTRDTAERFWEKVDRSSECWIWTGRLRAGYGRFWSGQRTDSAHRWSYEAANGPIPTGFVLDHLCRNRACVRPEHLEVVTNAENVRRGDKGRLVVKCAQGHAYTPENTYIKPNGCRNCKTCRRDRDRARDRARAASRGRAS